MTMMRDGARDKRRVTGSSCAVAVPGGGVFCCMAERDEKRHEQPGLKRETPAAGNHGFTTMTDAVVTPSASGVAATRTLDPTSRSLAPSALAMMVSSSV